MQRVIPYLSYADADKAIEFLTTAFGFHERLRYPMPDGRVGHAELAAGDAVIYLASEFDGFGASPLRLTTVHCQLFCLVEDVEAHFARARAAGATIVGDLHEAHGTRNYRALDPEGHRWMFAQKVGGGAES